MVSGDMETESCKHLENQTVAWELKYDSRDNTTEQGNCKTRRLLSRPRDSYKRKNLFTETVMESEK
jgi:hypothetical protein